MGCEDIGPTEETLDAIMEYLVGPLLPLKHTDSAKETPSESKQKIVAKQVHAAAVLYNYYHLRDNQESQFLKFDQFCKLVLSLKPSILQHLKYTCQSDHTVLNDPENQLSLTEKAVMDACAISETLLKASDNISNVIKDWKITKVAVLLIDAKKENCFLQFKNGVWSVIEKEVYPESKKRKKIMMDCDEENEVGFQKLAFLAVKEVAGIAYGNIKIIESHVVYSLSQAKTATRFYIVQSTQAINEDNLVPIQDVISSLQGPVVKKCLGSWAITPVVEYYYLLPYAEIISKLFSRESNSLLHQVKKSEFDFEIMHINNSCKEEPHDSKVIKNSYESNHCNGESKKVTNKVQKKSKLDSESVQISNSTNTKNSNKCSSNLKSDNKVADDVITLHVIERPVDQKVKETENSTGNSITLSKSDSMKKEDMNGSCRDILNISLNGVNNNLSESQSTKFQTPVKIYRYERRSKQSNSVNSKANLENLIKKSTTSQSKDEKVDGDCMVPSNENRSLIVNHVIEDFNSIVDAKKSELSDAALRALLNKRQKLYDQQRVTESELTLCDKKIQAIMHGGIGDCLSLKLEAVIECCNEICKQENMQTQHKDLDVSRSLSEARLTLRKACQELDDICLSNNWMLPTYCTSRSDGGFVANVIVKGANFECSGVSGDQPSIHEARNSAASHVITRLQQMANGMK